MTNKQNFEKDINVPSKEPIIIDGVDVSGCGFAEISNMIRPNQTKPSVKCKILKELKQVFHCVCQYNNDCYFKQLARKTQECEELKEEISKLQLNEYHYKNELKKYKKGIHKYRNLLKYEINDLRLSRREFLKTVGRYPKFEKDNIKLALDTFNRKLALIDNPSRYHKALEEIENFMNYEFSGQNEWVKTSILDIINKAKGEGNE